MDINAGSKLCLNCKKRNIVVLTKFWRIFFTWNFVCNVFLWKQWRYACAKVFMYTCFVVNVCTYTTVFNRISCFLKIQFWRKKSASSKDCPYLSVDTWWGFVKIPIQNIVILHAVCYTQKMHLSMEMRIFSVIWRFLKAIKTKSETINQI